MSRKDYIAIAQALKGTKEIHASTLGAASVLHQAADLIADALASENPRFDRQKFISACGF